MGFFFDKNGKFVSHNTYLKRADKEWRFVFKFHVSKYISIWDYIII